MSNVPGKIAEYFGDISAQAVISGGFRPGEGWYVFTAPAELDTLRGLHAQGYTTVAVTAAGRTADFTVDEVLGYGARPLLGGRLI